MTASSYAQTSDDSSLVIWAGSEVIRNEANSIEGKLCTASIKPLPNATIFLYLRMPNGQYYNNTSSAYETVNNCKIIDMHAPTPFVGEYTAYTEASWTSNGVTYNVTSNTSTYTVREGIFQNRNVTRIAEYTAGLSDWSADGNFVIGTYTQNSFLLMKPDGQIQSQIYVNDTVDMNCCFESTFDSICCPEISPSGKTVIFGGSYPAGNASRSGFFKLNLESSISAPVFSEIHENAFPLKPVKSDSSDGHITGLGGWVSDSQILFRGTDSTGKILKFLLVDAISGNITKELFTDFRIEDGHRISNPDVSVDGKKAVLAEIWSGEYFSSPFKFLVLDIASSKVMPVPYPVGGGCLGDVQWAGENADLILYTAAGCTHHTPCSSIQVVSSDGNYHEGLFSMCGVGGAYQAVVSPDGNSMIFCCDAQEEGGSGQETRSYGLFRIDFAHPMPEFNTFVILILAAGIVFSITLASKYAVFASRLQ